MAMNKIYKLAIKLAQENGELGKFYQDYKTQAKYIKQAEEVINDSPNGTI